MPTLTLDRLEKRYADHIVASSVSLSVADGEFVSLLGPSGCGKTTVLRMIAGLIEPSSGTVRIDDADVTRLPTNRRNVGLVFQSYALFPHMTVFENVAFGLRRQRVSGPDLDRRVEQVLASVRLAGYGSRYPRQLSGGQQQRVAVARSIAPRPSILLFDEPLSNLDAKLRAEMRVELRELQRRLDITSLYVTHDQEEALAISDRVIVMNAGKIEQIGSPEDIYDRPASHFVADFVGSANMIPGKVTGEGPDGTLTFETQGGAHLRIGRPADARVQGTVIALRSAYIHFGQTSGAQNGVAGTIHRRMFHGDFIQYVVDWPAGQLIVRRPPTELFDEGSTVMLSFDPTHCVLL